MVTYSERYCGNATSAISLEAQYKRKDEEHHDHVLSLGVGIIAMLGPSAPTDTPLATSSGDTKICPTQTQGKVNTNA